MREAGPRRGVGRLFVGAVLLAVGVSFGLALGLRESPPRDSRLVEQFRTSRAEFESLRHLLVEEAGAIDVAKWGVRAPQSPTPKVPPEGDFPRARFEEYLALLARAGGTIAFREAGSCPETCVIVWSSGWAGDTRHVAVCSLCAPPANLIDGLDAWWAKGNGAGGYQRVYRHLDGEWYLRADER